MKAAKSTPRGSKQWLEYKRCRNKCSNIIKSAKANFWKNEFQKSNSSKSFWKTLNAFKGKTKSSNIGPIKDKDTTITNDAKKAKLMNEFFANVGETLAKDINYIEPENMNSYIFQITPTMPNLKTSIEHVNKAFKKAVKPNKACGLDGWSERELNFVPETCISSLNTIFKSCLKYGKFPSQWKKAKVTCVYKKGKKNECSNYRPISLLSIPSKIFEQLINEQLCSHLDNFNLRSDFQWGFRNNRSTEDLLLYMSEKWHKDIDGGKFVGVLLIDFKKAFDSISHNILLKKLAAHGVTGTSLELLESYLSNRKQLTYVNGINSEFTQVNYGVPQGSILGPTSFIANVKDLPPSVESQTELLADDCTICECDSSIDLVID